MSKHQSRGGLIHCMNGLVFVILLVQPVETLALHAQVAQPTDSQPAEKRASKTASTVPQAITDDYLIGPDDLLNIYILDVPELSRVYRVSSSGNVTLPLLPRSLGAAGLTLRQFSGQVSEELKAAGLVNDPHVTTSVDQSQSHTVAITGAVKSPQIYPVFSRTTLLDVLSQAGGLTDSAGNTALVHRGDIAMRALTFDQKQASIPGQSEPQRTSAVDLKGLMESGDSNLNVPVYPGDRITVGRAGIVYVVGAVNKPGGFVIRSGSRETTVLQAIALAENAKGTAKPADSVIIRNDPNAPDGHARIPVDLKKVLSGKAPDPGLQAEDILFVPDSSGKRIFRRSIESILQVTTGVAIYSARF